MLNLKRLRSEKNLTQIELAKILGVSRATVINIEKHVYPTLSPKVEKGICDFFGITPFSLYGINNLKHKPETKEELEEFIDDLRKDFEQCEEQKKN